MDQAGGKTKTSLLEAEVLKCNTYGFKLTFDIDEYLTIEFPNLIVYIHRRPWYCDRGRFGFHIMPKVGMEWFVNIDHQDGFPRYFFNVQRAFDELNDWIVFNEERVSRDAPKYKK